MQVSYGKLTVNHGKEMAEQRLPLPRDDDDGCFAPEARRHTIGRCLWLYAVGNGVFRRLEKFSTL